MDAYMKFLYVAVMTFLAVGLVVSTICMFLGI